MSNLYAYPGFHKVLEIKIFPFENVHNICLTPIFISIHTTKRHVKDKHEMSIRLWDYIVQIIYLNH